MNPIADILARQGMLVLDGGLATELESLGCDLDDPLWSARALLDSPDDIREVCRRYLSAGADCVATATYQASTPGLAAAGLSHPEIATLLRDAVSLVVEERDRFWEDPSNRLGRSRPLVTASVGPYGAYLADGSEYRGDYGLSAADLYDFHADRWADLAGTAADVMACETTPSLEETLAYCRLAAVSGSPTWVSFQCPDERSLADGTPLVEAVAVCHEEPNIVAVGINCTDPRLVSALVQRARESTDLPVLVYPNSGEEWDAGSKTWIGAPTPTDWASRAREWREAGASGIGGCCRVGPADITSIRQALFG
ncbi:MAG: homocysteine S-methyltransferase [Gemmatimonadota bacterium]|nr:homocysteine S-methyltransferase [Gemmatimonadota bacterium]